MREDRACKWFCQETEVHRLKKIKTTRKKGCKDAFEFIVSFVSSRTRDVGVGDVCRR